MSRRAGLVCAADAGLRASSAAPGPLAVARPGHCARGGVRRRRGGRICDRGRPERPIGAGGDITAGQRGPRHLAGSNRPRRGGPGAGPAARTWPGVADRGGADEPGAARRSSGASGRDCPPRPMALWPCAGWLCAGPAGTLPPGTLPDAARRRRSGPFDIDRDRRPYRGRRLGGAAFAGPARVRTVQRGCRAGARDHGRRRTGIAAGTERPVSHVQLAGAAHGDSAAGVAAGRHRGPAGPGAGPPAADREPVQPERAVHRTGPSAGRGERGAAAVAARGRRRDRGAGAVHRPRGRRASPRSAGRARPAPPCGRPHVPLRPVRGHRIRMAVRCRAGRRRGRRDRGRGPAGEGRRGAGGRDPDAQPDHPRRGGRAGDRVACRYRAARRSGADAQREADRHAGGRGGVGPGGGAGRGHGQRSEAGAAARAALLSGCRGADVPRSGAGAAGSGARSPGWPGARPPRARQPRPLARAARASHRVHRRRRRPRRLRPRLHLDADQQRGRSGGRPGSARRTGLAGAGFQHPARVGSASALAGARGWHRAAIRRTDANYTSGGGTVTVPALGVPADGLVQIHGWRDSDGSAPLTTLARCLEPTGPVRLPGPMLPAGTRWLSLPASSPDLTVDVTADLRDPQGAIRQVAFGTTGTLLRAPVPPGRWELEALELDEPSGVAITNGHQNGENPAAATQSQTHVALGPLLALPAHGPMLLRVPLGAWRGVGAAAITDPVRSGAVAMVDFAMSGTPGVLRPAQPTDTRPVPVLADPQTAASAGPGGRIALTVDGLPVIARVVGVLSRFPTVPSDSAGFVIADESTLAAALDAQLPGQGRPDELWIGTAHLAGLRAALDSGTLAQLDSSFRVDIDHQLRDAPVARGVLGTLIAATALSAVLAVVGLLAALLGGVRDERVESDLQEQGVGPRGLRAELRVRLALASLLGVMVGVGIAVLLTRLAVASVSAAGAVADPSPPVVTVVPWAALAAWSAGTFAVLAFAGWLAPRGSGR